MAIVWNDVEAIAPQTSKALASTRVAVLLIVDAQIKDANWGALADVARRYLAAHLATLAMRGGNGAVTSESLGAMSRSYAGALGMTGSLAQTSYGQEYLRMVKLLPSALGVVY
jgi:hypothetical protein